MAYFNDPQDDELQQQQANGQAPQPIGPQGSTLQGSSAAGGAQPPAAAPSAPDKGSNFVGISQYLNANKSQAGRLGDQASNVITTSANDARSSLGNLNSSFNQKVGSAATIDQNILGKVNEAEKLQEPEKQQIKSAYNAQYTGPNSLTDLGEEYNTTGKKLSTAKKNVEGAGTEEGRQGLITQINSKPRTAGITNFDSVLLQAGGGREKLSQAAQANKDVAGDALGQSNLMAQQKAADVKAQTDATRTATQGAISQATEGFKKQFDPNDPNSKLAQQIAKALQANNDVAQDLGQDAYSLDEGTLGSFGLSEGQRSFGIDPSKYFQQADLSQINASNVASVEDYARSAALAELAGGESFLNPSDISKAGTAKDLMLKVDKEKLGADISAKNADYEKNYTGDKDFLRKFVPALVQPNEFGDTRLDNPTWAPMKAATPKELEQKWIPMLRKADGGKGLTSQYADYIERGLKNWRNSIGYDKTFKTNKAK